MRALVRNPRRTALVVVLVLAIGAAALGAARRSPDPPLATAVLLAAGDIGECGSPGTAATAKILAEYPDATIATLGDNAYEHGTPDEFTRCYAPSWGAFKDRTRPAPGNHDYGTKKAAGYRAYFGPVAGPPNELYYSYDLGAWHVVVLNSQCWSVGGCKANDDQIRWLQADLARSRARCTLAYWHRPPFSSGRYGDDDNTRTVRPMWQALASAGVDVVLTGHEHSYERFVPMNAEGAADPAGTRLIIAGTGGAHLRPYERPSLPTSAVRSGDAFGVLKLVLADGRYDWEFLPAAGGSFRDAGSGTCH